MDPKFAKEGKAPVVAKTVVVRREIKAPSSLTVYASTGEVMHHEPVYLHGRSRDEAVRYLEQHHIAFRPSFEFQYEDGVTDANKCVIL